MCKEKCLLILLSPVINDADAKKLILVKIRDEKD